MHKSREQLMFIEHFSSALQRGLLNANFYTTRMTDLWKKPGSVSMTGSGPFAHCLPLPWYRAGHFPAVIAWTAPFAFGKRTIPTSSCIQFAILPAFRVTLRESQCMKSDAYVYQQWLGALFCIYISGIMPAVLVFCFHSFGWSRWIYRFYNRPRYPFRHKPVLHTLYTAVLSSASSIRAPFPLPSVDGSSVSAMRSHFGRIEFPLYRHQSRILILPEWPVRGSAVVDGRGIAADAKPEVDRPGSAAVNTGQIQRTKEALTAAQAASTAFSLPLDLLVRWSHHTQADKLEARVSGSFSFGRVAAADLDSIAL